MSKQKSPRGLFCEVNRTAGGMVGRTFRTCSRSCSWSWPCTALDL